MAGMCRASVCYMKANQSRYLERLTKSYGMEQVTDRWAFEGVYFSKAKSQRKSQFAVYNFDDVVK